MVYSQALIAPAFHWLRSGWQGHMDTRRLQHFLGHASITNTVRYTATPPEPFKDVWRD
jgi:site-specific recombinase XerD